MKKVLKVVVLIIAGVIIVGVIAALCMFSQLSKQTEEALNAQVNEEIDMEQVADGTYTGTSEGGAVCVEVEVTVENHKIKTIDLIKHDNAKGKAAEAILDVMIANNTDDVDAVSGATASSKTIRNAVNKALQQGITRNAQ